MRKPRPKTFNYLLRNDKVQHEHRLYLERKYAEWHGRPVDYCDILHELQRKDVERWKERDESF